MQDLPDIQSPIELIKYPCTVIRCIPRPVILYILIIIRNSSQREAVTPSIQISHSPPIKTFSPIVLYNFEYPEEILIPSKISFRLQFFSRITGSFFPFQIVFTHVKYIIIILLSVNCNLSCFRVYCRIIRMSIMLRIPIDKISEILWFSQKIQHHDHFADILFCILSITDISGCYHIHIQHESCCLIMHAILVNRHQRRSTQIILIMHILFRCHKRLQLTPAEMLIDIIPRCTIIIRHTRHAFPLREVDQVSFLYFLCSQLPRRSLHDLYPVSFIKSGQLVLIFFLDLLCSQGSIPVILPGKGFCSRIICHQDQQLQPLIIGETVVCIIAILPVLIIYIYPSGRSKIIYLGHTI